jgi:hypothetical protein
MSPAEQAQVGLPENPSTGDREAMERQGSWNPDDIDLDALAVKVIELMRRELRIELERQGRT